MAYGSKTQQWLFYAAPAGIKDAITSVYGWSQRRDRYGADFQRHLRQLRESQHWPAEKLAAYQQECLQAFLKEAVVHVPYYAAHEVYRDIAVAELARLPLLPKPTVRARAAEFMRRDLARLPHRMVHTSGTTGQSLVFPVTAECFQREYAFRELHYEWGGVSLVRRQPFAFCAGHPVARPERDRPPFWTRDRVNNHLFFSSYHLAPRHLPAYVRALESFGPVALAGYPSAAYLLALAYRKHGRGGVRLKAVYTFSETLQDFQRAAIQDAFQCRVFNWYGNTEMCANIVECECGELHLKAEHSFVEVLNERNEPCRPGETGRLVCTGFGNRAFPLIRYEVGDTVTLSARTAARCGRAGVLVEQVLGRREDYIVTPDGRLVGRLDHLFKDAARVAEAQIVQRRRDGVILRIVRAPEYGPADEAALREAARLRLGPAARVDFEYVDRIARGPGGKFRFIISELDQAQLMQGL